MLADPEFANKAREGRADEINVCIACNQACLDLIFSSRVATCLVNPKAGREVEFDVPPPAAAQAHRRDRCRTGRARLRRHGGGARTCRDALRGADHASAASSIWPATCRARRSSTRRCATIGRRIERLGIDLQLGQQARCERSGSAWLRRDRRCDRRHAAHARHCGYRAGQLRELRRHPRRLARGRSLGRRHRRRRHRLRYCRVSSRRRRRTRRRSPRISGPSGASTRRSPAGADWRSRPRRTAARRVVMLQRKSGRMGRGLGVSTGWVLRLLLAKRKVAQVIGRHLPAHRRRQEFTSPSATRSASFPPIPWSSVPARSPSVRSTTS